jgi:UDP-glucose 4-epimerase
MAGVAFVIGGCGFLGQRLTSQLLREGWRVGVIDPGAPADGAVAVGVPGATVQAVRGLVSASALARLGDSLGPATHTFHLGGSASVGAAERDAEHDRVLTVESTRELVAAARSMALGRLVLVSSAAVYGDGGAQRLEEGRPLAPISTYGRHKAAAEDLLLGAVGSSAIVRFFSLYGPGLRKQLLWDACHKLRAPRPTFAGTGAELRDWLHVDDAVTLLGIVASAGERQLLVNGGTGIGTSVASALGTLAAALPGAHAPVFSGEVRSADPVALVADPRRAEALGWRPAVSVERGLAEYARWFDAQAC